MKKVIFLLIIVLALVGLFGLRSRHEAEKRRQAEIARQQEVAREQAAKLEAERIAKENEEAEKARRAEAQRKREEAKAKILQERREEQARKEREKKAVQEKAAEVAQDARSAACDKILAALKNGVLRPWKTIQDGDQPDTSKGECTFLYVFPDDDGGRMFLELKTMFGRSVALRRLDSVTSAEQYEPNEFRQLAAVFPHLLLSGDRIYFRSSRAELDPCRVPATGASFNPAEHDFGGLYETVAAAGLNKDAFVYGVYFRPFGTEIDIPVAKVAFGKSVPAAEFQDKVSKWVKRNKAELERGRAAAKKWKPTVVFTDKTQIKRRVDGVTEVPREFVPSSNKHRYSAGTQQYEEELQKESAARRKWQLLFDEAKSQEARAKQLSEKKGGEGFLESGSVVYRLYEEPKGK